MQWFFLVWISAVWFWSKGLEWDVAFLDFEQTEALHQILYLIPWNKDSFCQTWILVVQT